MFCSNCGKTLKAEMAKCPHCGAVIGESRFEGHPYTGAQVRIRPGEAVRLPGNHTRTTYMSSDSSMEGDVETRTTYRATIEGAAPLYDQPEPLYNAVGEEAEYEEALLPDDSAEADYLTAAMAAEPAGEPSEDASEAEEEEEEDIDIDREDREEEERERAARKAQRKAKREARRAERRQREAEREAREDEELGEPIEDDEEEDEAESRRARRAARRQRAQEENADDELSELRAREIEEVKPAGFSEDVKGYMNERRNEYEEKKRSEEEKAEKKKKRVRFSWRRNKTEESFEEGAGQGEDFDLDEAPVSPAAAFAAADQKEYGEEFSAPESQEAPEEFAGEFEDAGEYEPDEEAQYVSDDDELVFTSENPNVPDDFSDVDLTFDDEEDFVDEETLARRRKVFNMLKYVIAAGIVVAIIVGVTTLLSNIAHDTQKTQIPNVSTVLFEQGVELMQSRVGDDYIKLRLGQYDRNNSSSLVAVSEAMSKDLDDLDTLLPENPDLNDQRFINALKAIQEDINNCLTNDILSLSDATKTNEVKQSESDARWLIVREKVEELSKATDKSKLDAIIKGERIEVIQQATPEPAVTSTPEPYVKLSKGSKGEAVTKLQQRLTSLGYMTSEIDGDYGNKTKTAVQLFQKEAGLETTGIADVTTQERLFAPDAPMKGN